MRHLISIVLCRITTARKIFTSNQVKKERKEKEKGNGIKKANTVIVNELCMK